YGSARPENRNLSLIPHTEYCHYPRAGMASDHGSDVVDKDVVNVHLLTHKFCHIFCVFQAVAVCDHDNVIVPAFCLLYCHVNDLVKGFFTSALFPDHLKFSFIVHMYDGFDLDECAEYSSCLGDPTAPVQMVQVVYCDIVADMKF